MLTFKKFQEQHKGGYYIKAAEDIKGFAKKGQSLYGDCDNLIVEDWLYQPLNGIYTVFLKNAERGLQ